MTDSWVTDGYRLNPHDRHSFYRGTYRVTRAAVVTTAGQRGVCRASLTVLNSARISWSPVIFSGWITGLV